MGHTLRVHFHWMHTAEFLSQLQILEGGMIDLALLLFFIIHFFYAFELLVTCELVIQAMKEANVPFDWSHVHGTHLSGN